MTNNKIFKKEDKIEDLGYRICRFVDYYDKDIGRIPELAALGDALFCIKEILKSYDKRFKRIEDELGIYTEEEIKKIKVGGTDPD